MFRYYWAKQTPRHIEVDHLWSKIIYDTTIWGLSTNHKLTSSKDAYLVQKYGQVIHSVGKIKRLFERKAMPERKPNYLEALFHFLLWFFIADHPDFLTCATQLAALLHHTIFVDQVVYPIAYRDEIIELLEDHITSNIVKVRSQTTNACLESSLRYPRY